MIPNIAMIRSQSRGHPEEWFYICSHSRHGREYRSFLERLDARGNDGLLTEALCGDVNANFFMKTAMGMPEAREAREKLIQRETEKQSSLARIVDELVRAGYCGGCPRRILEEMTQEQIELFWRVSQERENERAACLAMAILSAMFGGKKDAG